MLNTFSQCHGEGIEQGRITQVYSPMGMGMGMGMQKRANPRKRKASIKEPQLLLFCSKTYIV